MLRNTLGSRVAALVLAVLVSGVGGACGGAPDGVPATSRGLATADRHLLIVVDGLRPDYVTPEIMPTLSALAQRGVRFTRHHSVFPTVTRVNASSFSTGAYPERHGLLGNSVYFPGVDATALLDTADLRDLDRIAAREPALLTATTLGEVLQAAGQRMLVAGSGTPGAALLNNHTVAGGAVLHRAFTRPETFTDAVRALPSAPGPEATGAALDRHAVDMFLDVGLPQVDPTVTVLWLGALDATAHANGVGAPATVEVLKQVDTQIGRLQEGLAARGLRDAYTIWVSSDHGFSTHAGPPAIAAALAPFSGTLPDGTPRVVSSGGAVYVRDDAAAVVEGVVRALQRTPGVGAVFTKAVEAGELDGVVSGTLSLDAVRWQHARSAPILFTGDWTDAANTFGMPGTVAAGGTAGHGSASRWDVHNTLIAAGPRLRHGLVVDAPSANVDLAPTILAMLGLRAPDSMQGRVLAEAFAAGETHAEAASSVETTEHTARTADGCYAVTAAFSTVRTSAGTYRYFDSASRLPPDPAASCGASTNQTGR